MSKQVLIAGAVLTILVATLLTALSILDIVTFQEATKTLGKTASVIGIFVVALILMISIVRIRKAE